MAWHSRPRIIFRPRPKSTRILSPDRVWNYLIGSAVEQVRFAALAELRGRPVPLLQKLREPAALDGQSHLVRPREAVDGCRPGEVARVPAAGLVDEQERRAHR